MSYKELNMKELNCKVGEIWETSEDGLDKEIIYVTERNIVALAADCSRDRERFVYVYNEFGQPQGSSTLYSLVRKKVKLKTIKVVRYAPLFYDNRAFFGTPEITKSPYKESSPHFIKWVEIKESFEVEV